MGKVSEFIGQLDENVNNVVEAVVRPIESVGDAVSRVLGGVAGGVEQITDAATLKTEVKVDYMSIILPVLGLALLIKLIK